MTQRLIREGQPFGNVFRDTGFPSEGVRCGVHVCGKEGKEQSQVSFFSQCPLLFLMGLDQIGLAGRPVSSRVSASPLKGLQVRAARPGFVYMHSWG